MIIKIDNITSIDEIKVLNNFDIDIVTLKYKKYSILNRTFNIKNMLSEDKLLCISFNEYLLKNENDLIDIVNQIRPNYIQLSSNYFLSDETIKKLILLDINVIYKYSLDCDEDPMWAFPSFSSTLDEKEIIQKFKNENFLLQLNIMSNYDNGWNMLKNECGKFNDDLTIEELNEFTSKYQTFIHFNFNENNISEIIKNLPRISGFVFEINDNLGINDLTKILENSLRKIKPSK